MANILNLRCDAGCCHGPSVRIEKHCSKLIPGCGSLLLPRPRLNSRGSCAGRAHPAWDPDAPLPILTAVPDDGGWGPTAVVERLEPSWAVRCLPFRSQATDRYRLLALPSSELQRVAPATTLAPPSEQFSTAVVN